VAMFFPRIARPVLPLSLATSLALGVPCMVEGGVTAPALHGTRALELATAASPLAILAVANCADSGPGSLRDAITNAADGATIDIPHLLCSKITLASGSLPVTQNNLTVNGPGRSLLQIVPDVNQTSPVFAHSGTGLLTISGLRVANAINSGPTARGGCITSSAGSVRVVAAEVTYCLAHQTVSGAEMTGGGAIYAKGDVTIEDSLVTRSTAYGYTARVAGGGVFASGNIFVRRSVIDRNVADPEITPGTEFGYGGGLAAKRSIEIVDSTVSYNRVGRVQGGAIGSLRGLGGGVFALDYYGGSTLVLTNSTVSNKIIANNTYVSGGPSTYDFSHFGATVSGSRNLITVSSVSPAGTLTSNPALGALADNGGPTLTHALFAGSPAIGAGGNPLGLASDQRGPGFSRVFAGFVDIGAFQTGDAIFANGLEPPS
jgi:hypothetical protein